jgi:hypothetical protein
LGAGACGENGNGAKWHWQAARGFVKGSALLREAAALAESSAVLRWIAGAFVKFWRLSGMRIARLDILDIRM